MLTEPPILMSWAALPESAPKLTLPAPGADCVVFTFRFPLRLVAPIERLLVLLIEAVLPVSCTTALVRTFALVSEMLPVVPALNTEFEPVPVVVKIDEPNWLIDPPVEVTSKRLAVAVGRTMLPAVEVKTAGPPDEPVETEPVEVALMDDPWTVMLVPVIGPLIKAVPSVLMEITAPLADPPRSDKTGARLAGVPPPPPKPTVIGLVKPEPDRLVATPVTAPPVIVAVAAAPVPPPPVNVTVGTET